ncbi:MAG: ABC transporter permease subunit [Phycisphaerales bacterium]|nr:ABC transporter permease subunit [Phycisphaerales bacterium]MCB9841172.1 ABC transporter permease subunit [Phycisphaeraceae bacterium]
MPLPLTIAAREYAALFRLPVGWIVIALYLFLSGVVFLVGSLAPGSAATLRTFFGVSTFLLLPVCPAITMRLLADELRSGTMESLMTAPVPDLAIVLGKYVAAVAFLGTMLVPTLAFPAILFYASDPAPDVGPIAAGYLSLILTGCLYLALGTLASALTSSQTLAFLGTFMTILAILLVSSVAADQVPEPWGDALRSLSISARVTDFARGVIDSAHVVFFLSASAFVLMLTHVAVESRRWR